MLSAASAGQLTASVASALEEHRAELADAVRVARAAGIEVAVLVDLRPGTGWVRIIGAEEARELVHLPPERVDGPSSTPVVVATERGVRVVLVDLEGPC